MYLELKKGEKWEYVLKQPIEIRKLEVDKNDLGLQANRVGEKYSLKHVGIEYTKFVFLQIFFFFFYLNFTPVFM